VQLVIGSSHDLVCLHPHPDRILDLPALPVDLAVVPEELFAMLPVLVEEDLFVFVF